MIMTLSLNSKYDIYDSAGYKLFHLRGMFIPSTGSALNPAELADGSYAVEEITDDSVDRWFKVY